MKVIRSHYASTSIISNLSSRRTKQQDAPGKLQELIYLAVLAGRWNGVRLLKQGEHFAPSEPFANGSGHRGQQAELEPGACHHEMGIEGSAESHQRRFQALSGNERGLFLKKLHMA